MAFLNSVTGYAKDDLYQGTEPPPWIAEAEARFGPMRKTSALQLPEGRSIFLTAFERGWRLTLRSSAAPPDQHETDIWLSLEGMESILFLEEIGRASCRERV